jgi:hypothetical protein
MSHEDDVENLLNLDGQMIELSDGYWVKFSVSRTDQTEQIPHGIYYSLTLHRQDNHRILGYDNAHAVQPEGGHFRFAGQVLPYDHQHRYASGNPAKKAIPYTFETPGQLVADFWNSVDDALKQEKQP